MKTRNFLLAGLTIAAASATLASCDEPEYKMSLNDIYSSICDQCVHLYKDQDLLQGDIQCYPTLLAPNTNNDCKYTVLNFDVNLDTVTYGADKVNYILSKNINSILTSCGFTYDDYKTLYSKRNKERINLDGLSAHTVEDSSNPSTSPTLKNSNLEAISIEKGCYYSEEINLIFEQSMDYTCTEETDTGSEKHKYYTCSLTNTLIKGNSLMEISDTFIKFVRHDHLSKTYIAKIYEQNKNNPTKI